MTPGAPHWCFHCYAINAASSGPCVHCGKSIEPPETLTYDERLIWTLGHPDGDRAVLAARILGEHQSVSAVPALRAAVERGSDPFLAAEALRSLIRIEDIDRLRGLLQEAATSDSVLVADVARKALDDVPCLGCWR